MRLFIFCLLLFANELTAQINFSDSTSKSSFLIYSSNENISESDLNFYKSAVLNFSNLDEFRFLDQRRVVYFEKGNVSVELFSANELFEKYGKEVPMGTITPGSKYLPVIFQLINWENAYTINPLFDKFNELTY